MRIKKTIVAVVSCFAIALVSPSVNIYAENSSVDIEAEVTDVTIDEIETHNDCACNLAATLHDWNIKCDHSDPTSWLHPHSTMRYIRSVGHYNYIDNVQETWEYYQCIVCGYETPFVRR